MNIVFYVLLIMGILVIYILISSLFRIIGGWTEKIIQRFVRNVMGEEIKNKEESDKN